jgi:hypothetical protein
MAGILYPEQTPGVLAPATVNPLLLRQVQAQRAANPRPNVTDLFGYGPDLNSYASNLSRNFAGQFEGLGTPQNFMGPFGFGGIVSPKVARTLNTAKNLPSNEVFKSAVLNTPGASIADEGLLMRVARSQRPEQGLHPSVRGGVFYLPEGAPQMKHYSTGKHGYGGKEKITGETLFSNPVFVKGATGGKAPEAAFDSIKGKGAYQAMRSHAIGAYGPYGASHAVKVESAERFLREYAPELAGYADDIVRNSREGNQLAYALQEAAVGSAVRNAGHDAVLGYSIARSTKQPFISEVFDVREMNYPDKFGTPTDIWDAFKK